MTEAAKVATVSMAVAMIVRRLSMVSFLMSKEKGWPNTWSTVVAAATTSTAIRPKSAGRSQSRSAR